MNFSVYKLSIINHWKNKIFTQHTEFIKVYIILGTDEKKKITCYINIGNSKCLCHSAFSRQCLSRGREFAFSIYSLHVARLFQEL